MDLGNGRKPVLFDHNGREIATEKRYDDFAVPHIVSFSSILSSGFKTYFHGKWDEALKKGREHAITMRNDANLQAILGERYRGVCALKWHLAVEDDYDKHQLFVKDHLTKVIKRTPRFTAMRRYLQEAVWYGRYASQVKWDWEMIESDALGAVRSLYVKKHMPVSGDKIGHMMDHTPYILINSASRDGDIEGRPDLTYTTEGGQGLILRGSWRERFIINVNEMEDADFFDPVGAEMVHGVGVRHRLFWWDWLKREWLAWVVDFLERVGLGVTLFPYDASNPKSLEEAKRAAHEQSRRSVILWPVFPDAGGRAGAPQRIETPVAGAQILLQMIQYVDSISERLIIGQNLSAGTEGSGLGGSGVAALHADTKSQIIALDAENLAETLTNDMVEVSKRWTFPWADFPVYFKFDVSEPEPEAALGAVSMAYNLGVSFKEEEVRALTGMSDPEPDDNVIRMPQQDPNAMGAGGMPGQPPPGGQPAPPGQAGGGQEELLKGLQQHDEGFESMLGGAEGKPQRKARFDSPQRRKKEAVNA